MQSLIVLTSPQVIKNESELLTNLFKEGLKRLHIRKPYWSIIQIQKLISDIPCQYYSKIVIHHQWNLKEINQFLGIHGWVENHRKKKWDKVRSVPCHSIQEWLKLPSFISYAFLSPIFNSISKSNLLSIFNLKQLQQDILQVKKTNNIPLFALGGISHTVIKPCFEMGFDGVVVLGSIWLSKNPVKEFLKIKQTVEQLYGN